MSAKSDLDLDAILAEFRLPEEQPSPEETGEPAPVPRRERKPIPQPAAPEESAPVPEREEAPAAPPAEERDEPRSGRPKRQPDPRRKRQAAGRALMALVILALAAALWGLVRWTARAEQENLPPEPEPLRLELGEALESYLDGAATSSHG